jgi:hypothetical protein
VTQRPWRWSRGNRLPPLGHVWTGDEYGPPSATAADPGGRSPSVTPAVTDVAAVVTAREAAVVELGKAPPPSPPTPLQDSAVCTRTHFHSEYGLRGLCCAERYPELWYIKEPCAVRCGFNSARAP